MSKARRWSNIQQEMLWEKNNLQTLIVTKFHCFSLFRKFKIIFLRSRNSSLANSLLQLMHSYVNSWNQWIGEYKWGRIIKEGVWLYKTEIVILSLLSQYYICSEIMWYYTDQYIYCPSSKKRTCIMNADFPFQQQLWFILC